MSLDPRQLIAAYENRREYFASELSKVGLNSAVRDVLTRCLARTNGALGEYTAFAEAWIDAQSARNTRLADAAREARERAPALAKGWELLIEQATAADPEGLERVRNFGKLYANVSLDTIQLSELLNIKESFEMTSNILLNLAVQRSLLDIYMGKSRRSLNLLAKLLDAILGELPVAGQAASLAEILNELETTPIQVDVDTASFVLNKLDSYCQDLVSWIGYVSLAKSSLR